MKIIDLFSRKSVKNTNTSAFDLLDTFYQLKIQTKKTNTKRTYQAYYRNLIKFEELQSTAYESVTQQLINRLAYFLSKTINSSFYIKRIIGFLKSAYKYAYESGFIKENPFYSISLPRSSFERRTPLNSIEAKKLISNYNLLSSKLKKVSNVANFQMNTGLSYCDLKRVKREWLTSMQGNFFLIGTRLKTNTDFCIPLSKGVYNYLVSVNFNVPVMSNQKYNKYLNELARIQGIKRKITSHDLRVSFGQRQLDKGYSIEAVAHMLGHNRIETTMKHYTKLSKERVFTEVMGKIR